MAKKLSRMAEARELIAEIHKLMGSMGSKEQREITRCYDMTFPFITAFQFGWITGVDEKALIALRETLVDIRNANATLYHEVKVGDLIEWTNDGKRVQGIILRIEDFSARMNNSDPSLLWVNLFWHANEKKIKIIR